MISMWRPFTPTPTPPTALSRPRATNLSTHLLPNFHSLVQKELFLSNSTYGIWIKQQDIQNVFAHWKRKFKKWCHEGEARLTCVVSWSNTWAKVIGGRNWLSRESQWMQDRNKGLHQVWLTCANRGMTVWNDEPNNTASMSHFASRTVLLGVCPKEVKWMLTLKTVRGCL